MDWKCEQLGLLQGFRRKRNEVTSANICLSSFKEARLELLKFRDLYLYLFLSAPGRLAVQ
jgi:hypothetical protein